MKKDRRRKDDGDLKESRFEKNNEKENREENSLEELEDALDREEDDEEPETDRSTIAVTLMGFAIAALVLIIVVLIASGVLTGGNSSSQKQADTGSVEEASETVSGVSNGYVSVPDITGKTEEEAQKLLSERHLGMKFEDEQTSNKEEGTIIEQNPKAGAKVSEYSTVTYVRSSGPERVEFPDVTGNSLVDAKVELSNMGFENIEVEQRHSSRALGTVIKSSPEADKKATTTAKVVLTVSIGKKSQTAYAGDYLGLSASDAAEQAAKAGIICDITYGESDFAEVGKVMSQDVEPGSQVASGTIVTLTVNEKQPESGELETSDGSGEADSSISASETAEVSGSVTLASPKNYGGGQAVFVLVQEKDGVEYQIVEKRMDQADFPVSLSLKKVIGVSKGTLWLYEQSGDHLSRRASWKIS